MSKYVIFTDASVHPQLCRGCGAFLFLSVAEIEANVLQNHSDKIKTQFFVTGSSSAAELMTLLWAVSQIKAKYPADELRNNLIIYSDSQNISNLLNRRVRLESNNFVGKSSQKTNKLAPLYKQFYACYDDLNFEIRKIAGHKKKGNRETLDHIFSLVDQACRKALRNHISEIINHRK